MKTKLRMKLEIKEISAEGSFEGMLSPYGNVDGGGDIVEPGAYVKTLKDQGPDRPLLWQHKSDVPIGKLTLEDRPDGLWAKGQLLMSLGDAQKAYQLIKAQIVKGLSIGFESVKDSIENGVRHLKEIKLWEGSIVTFPMNEAALIASVKKAKEHKDDFNEELADIQMMDAGYQMRCALMCALDSMIWSGASKEAILSTSETVIQQFSDAYMAYLSPYIDMLTEMGYLGGGMEMMAASRKKLEEKSGRKISSETKDMLSQARDHMKSAHDIVSTLVDDAAGDQTTSITKEADLSTTVTPVAVEVKTEPVQDHSAATALIGGIKELIRAA